MPPAKTTEQLCAQYGISQARYQEESTELLGLGYTQEQANRLILRGSSKNTVAYVVAYHGELISHLNRGQIVRVAAHGGGSQNLKAVSEHLEALKALGFSVESIVRMVSHDGGSKNLKAVSENLEALQALGFAVEAIERMVSHHGGSQNLKAVSENHVALKDLRFSVEAIVRMVSHDGGSQNLKAVSENQAALKDLGFGAEAIVRMVSHDGGSRNLKAVSENLAALQDLGFRAEAIVRMVSHNGGSLNLKAVSENHVALKALGFGVEFIERMVSHGGGSRNLKVMRELGETARSYGIVLRPMKCANDRALLYAAIQEQANLRALGANHEALFKELEALLLGFAEQAAAQVAPQGVHGSGVGFFAQTSGRKRGADEMHATDEPDHADSVQKTNPSN
jgi:Holliday junction resolvasome RuvABC DNA-binding subunit